MTIREQFFTLRQSFFDVVAVGFQKVATAFGFPENPGMPLFPQREYFWNKVSLSDDLPVRNVRFPPDTNPQNYIEILIGDSPKPNPLPRFFYESKADGFYSFYIENYKNLMFLPNWLSEFLQVRCHLCLDITFLEVCRETVFIMLVIYFYMITFRILIAWLVTINPYTFPIAYFVALIDWIEDASMGLLPVVGGISLSTPLLLTIVGKIADSLNHLVFTMPFLPSEGIPGKAIINGDIKNVLIFRYLPILWYKYPIPNEIREFWYNERPDILKYMQKAYENVDIQFLPDRIIKANEFISTLPIYDVNHLGSYIDLKTNLLTINNGVELQEFFDSWNSIIHTLIATFIS